MTGYSLNCRAGLWFLAILFNTAACANQDLDKCAKAIDRIKSYDVTYRLDYLQYPGFNTRGGQNDAPVVAFSETNRDVFATKLGRRLENGITSVQTHIIAVVDWKKAESEHRPLSEALRNALPGLTYGDYLDPVVGPCFLSDLLLDAHSQTSLLGAGSLALSGFQIDNSRLHGRVRLWLDPSHGGMPAKLEWYEETGVNRYVLRRVIQIEGFIEIDKGQWVPSKASSAEFVAIGRKSPLQAFSGKRIEIERTKSLWNTPIEIDSFLSKTLPKFNYSSDGWDYDYPNSMLKVIKAHDHEAFPIVTGRSTVRAIVLFTVALVPAFLIMYYFFKKNRRSL